MTDEAMTIDPAHPSPDPAFADAPVSPGGGDDWLDGLLRADGQTHRHGYIADDGFTARVAAALPAPATLPRWRRPALFGLWAAGGVGAAWAAPGVVLDVAREAIRVFGGHPVAATDVAAGIALVAIAAFAAAAASLHDG
jgi:hypothetical protein